MADGAVNFLLDKLTTILLQKASLLSNIARNEIEQIKLELESMRSFLRDAERRKERSESVETWVSQVREVAYEAEDIIDEYIHYKSNQRWLNNGFQGVVQDVVNIPKNITARNQISSKLQKIKAKVQEVSERSKRYGFDQLEDDRRTRNVAGDRWQQYGESASFVDEDEIVGMEENTEKLLGLLLKEEPRRTVISIVGMGGLGKTTLVTRVYNNQIIKRNFDCWAWISVSPTYGIEDLLRSMIKEIFDTTQLPIPGKLGSMNTRKLVGILIDILHQKKYIIVLDDVWSIEFWSVIRCAFPCNKYGSRIVLTTRHENVASAIGIGSHVHRLQPLEEKNAWSLFCKKVFWNDPEHKCPEELRSLAEALVRKCEGLPLAIVAVGGLMCSRSKRVSDWKSVYASLNWQLSKNPMLEHVKGILLLSFKDLPFYLKHCFLYCCVFRDGHPIKRKKLIRLWVAEGFITERKGMTMEEIAEEHLTELILRSMIQVTATNEAGRVKLCRVHDVMRELAMTTCEKENFCTAFDGYNVSRLEEKIHRLSIYSTGENIQLSSTISRHLRSFFVFPTDMCSSFSLKSISSKFKLLRVLNLEGVPIETIPATLVELFNLRYLNLRRTKIKELPKSMEKLNNLQTLDVWKTNVESLPSGVSKLYNLRHLFVCRNNDQSSENLLSGIQAPAGIWHIRSLQTIACIKAEQELLQQVGNLTELKRLEITKLRAVDGPKLCTSIQRMTGLCRLSIMAANAEEKLQLEGLSLPPSFLQKLKLVGKLNRLPLWLGSLSSLTHLYLSFSCLEDILYPLHKLPNLSLLELKKAYYGTLLHFRAGWFPRLNKMVFLQLEQLNSFELEVGSLPSIQEFYIIGCQELKALPYSIEHLTSLQNLHLEEMTEELVQKLENGADEYQEKLKHIPTIKLVYLTGETRIVETL